MESRVQRLQDGWSRGVRGSIPPPASSATLAARNRSRCSATAVIMALDATAWLLLVTPDSSCVNLPRAPSVSSPDTSSCVSVSNSADKCTAEKPPVAVAGPVLLVYT